MIEYTTINNRQQPIVFRCRQRASERQWQVSYRIAGIWRTHECNGMELERLLAWCIDRADSATVSVRPVIL